MSDENWKQWANCKGEPLENFFEAYENSNKIQLRIDAMCANCVVKTQCLDWAIENDLQGGVFGRKFLGKMMTKEKQLV